MVEEKNEPGSRGEGARATFREQRVVKSVQIQGPVEESWGESWYPTFRPKRRVLV